MEALTSCVLYCTVSLVRLQKASKFMCLIHASNRSSLLRFEIGFVRLSFLKIHKSHSNGKNPSRSDAWISTLPPIFPSFQFLFFFSLSASMGRWGGNVEKGGISCSIVPSTPHLVEMWYIFDRPIHIHAEYSLFPVSLLETLYTTPAPLRFFLGPPDLPRPKCHKCEYKRNDQIFKIMRSPEWVVRRD